jgi:hypothetical protein
MSMAENTIGEMELRSSTSDYRQPWGCVTPMVPTPAIVPQRHKQKRHDANVVVCFFLFYAVGFVSR